MAMLILFIIICLVYSGLEAMAEAGDEWLREIQREKEEHARWQEEADAEAAGES